MFDTTSALNYRQNNRDLFERGEYLPLQAAGSANATSSFAQRIGAKTAIVIATRFFLEIDALDADRTRGLKVTRLY